MKPSEERNGDESGGELGGESGGESDGSGSGSGSGGEHEVVVEDSSAPRRALLQLNALRKARQHYDVILLAAGGADPEVPAHTALLAAASPHLLAALSPPGGGAGGGGAVPVRRVAGVRAAELRALVEFVYTGRVWARDVPGARRLYAAAWRLRLEAARALLAAALVRRARHAPKDALVARALPGLSDDHRRQLDAAIADNLEEVMSLCGGALPLVRLQLLRATSRCGGAEAAPAVAAAALAWLRRHHADTPLQELSSRTHLVYVDSAGALRDCGQLPPAAGDGAALQDYRDRARERERERERALARQPQPPPQVKPRLEPLQLGAREHDAGCAVLAAQGQPDTGSPSSMVTRAVLSLPQGVVAALVTWRGGCGVGAAGAAVGGPLGGGAADDGAGGERRARLCAPRAAAGAAVLGARLVLCGGYDRGRVLASCAAYCPAANAWAPRPALRVPRARFPAAALGRALYVVGGSDGHNELDTVDCYEEPQGEGEGEGKGRWVTATRLPVSTSHAGAAADELCGALYVAGGWAAGRPQSAVYRYSPRSGQWEDQPPLSSGRSQLCLVLWRGALWALGGCDAWHCLSSTETMHVGYGERNDAGRRWQPGPPLPSPRRSVGGAVWRGRLVAAGGSDGAASLAAVDWLLGAAGNESGPGGWRSGPALRRPRAALSLAELGGVLYAVGGFDGKEFLSSVECLYHPDGEWTTLCVPPPLRSLKVAAPSDTAANGSPAVAANCDPNVADNGGPAEAAYCDPTVADNGGPSVAANCVCDPTVAATGDPAVAANGDPAVAANGQRDSTQNDSTNEELAANVSH